MKRLIAFFLAVILPIIFFLYFDGSGIPEKPKLKRYFAQNENYQPEYSVEVDDTTWHIVPPFEFMGHNGQLITEKTFEDKIFIVDFFFTRCPGICPKLTAAMKRVQDRLAKEKDVFLLSHTVDPKYDTPKVLARYASRFEADSTRWFFVNSGNIEVLNKLATKGYFVSVGSDPSEEGGVEAADHTGRLILVDKNRMIRGFYEGTDPEAVDQLIEDTYVLKLEYEEKEDIIYDPQKKI